jgi:hypothetical protein
MKTKKGIQLMLSVMSLIGIAVFFFGCGGGGGSSGTPASDGSSSTGSVALFFSDAPDENLTELWIDVTKISLLPPGNGKENVVFEDPSGEPINLLNHQDGDDFFLTLKKVPAGSYEKIRLEVADIYAVGGPCDENQTGQYIKLPSSRIDLNPQTRINVVRGEALRIKMDIDVNKSFQLHQAGKSGKCIFRPVMFVDIEKFKPSTACPQIIQGTIEEVNLDQNQFLIGLKGRRGTVTVEYKDNVTIYDENGDLSTEDALVGKKGLPAVVRGKFTSYGTFAASLIVIGEVDDVKGTVGSPVDETSMTFPLAVDSGQELIGTWNVQASNGTLILFSCDEPANFNDIQPGMRAKVIGKVFSDGTNPAYIKAVAIMLEQQKITGQLTSVEPAGPNSADYIFTIETAPSNTVEVLVVEDTPVEFVGDGSVDIELLAQLTACGTHPLVKVTATPSPDTTPNLAAQRVDVVPEKVSGAVTSVADNMITISTESQGVVTVEVQNGAFVFRCSKNYGPVPLSSIRVGDQVAAFGLTDCRVQPAQFLAFMVVIDKWDDTTGI